MRNLVEIAVNPRNPDGPPRSRIEGGPSPAFSLVGRHASPFVAHYTHCEIAPPCLVPHGVARNTRLTLLDNYLLPDVVELPIYKQVHIL